MGTGSEAPTRRCGPGQQAVDETAQRGDVVGGGRTVEARPPAQAGSAAVTEQDVRGVEAPVHDAEVVEVSQCRGHRGGEAADVGDRAVPPRDGLARVGGAQLAGRGGGSSAGRDRRLEVAARHEGHDAGVAGVCEAGRLVAQPIDGLRPGGGLDGDEGVAVEVDRDVHVHAVKNADKH